MIRIRIYLIRPAIFQMEGGDHTTEKHNQPKIQPR